MWGLQPWLVWALPIKGPIKGTIVGLSPIQSLLTGCRGHTQHFQLNAAVTVQTLIDVFSVSGIVHYGTAGSCNDSISFGDVSVPRLVAYTGAWTWKKFRSPRESSAELSFGEYNVPDGGGENLLGSLRWNLKDATRLSAYPQLHGLSTG